MRSSVLFALQGALGVLGYDRYAHKKHEVHRSECNQLDGCGRGKGNWVPDPKTIFFPHSGYQHGRHWDLCRDSTQCHHYDTFGKVYLDFKEEGLLLDFSDLGHYKYEDVEIWLQTDGPPNDDSNRYSLSGGDCFHMHHNKHVKCHIPYFGLTHGGSYKEMCPLHDEGSWLFYLQIRVTVKDNYGQVFYLYNRGIDNDHCWFSFSYCCTECPYECKKVEGSKPTPTPTPKIEYTNKYEHKYEEKKHKETPVYQPKKLNSNHHEKEYKHYENEHMPKKSPCYRHQDTYKPKNGEHNSYDTHGSDDCEKEQDYYNQHSHYRRSLSYYDHSYPEDFYSSPEDESSYESSYESSDDAVTSTSTYEPKEYKTYGKPEPIIVESPEGIYYFHYPSYQPVESKTTEEPKPTEKPKPTEQIKPTEEPKPTEVPKPTEEAKPQYHGPQYLGEIIESTKDFTCYKNHYVFGKGIKKSQPIKDLEKVNTGTCEHGEGTFVVYSGSELDYQVAGTLSSSQGSAEGTYVIQRLTTGDDKSKIIITVSLDDDVTYATGVSVFVSCDAQNGDKLWPGICDPDQYEVKSGSFKHGIKTQTFVIKDDFECEGEYFFAIAAKVCGEDKY